MSASQLNGIEVNRHQRPAPGAKEPPQAPRRARLELVIEGSSHFCVDGTVIGSSGNLPSDLSPRWAALEPRHLLLGTDGDAWFVFTPLTVVRPFTLDGEHLTRGERRLLTRVRHHLALDDVRIGLRLHPGATGGLWEQLRRFLAHSAFKMPQAEKCHECHK
jgi:hypothetical protein